MIQINKNNPINNKILLEIITSDFSGNCNLMNIIINEICEFHFDLIDIRKIDFQLNSSKNQYQLAELPILNFYNKNLLVDQVIGKISKDKLNKKIINIINGVAK